jgi:uncharacterized protein YndB with AHSA1/START domain
MSETGWTHERSWRVEAPTDAVFAALTEPRQLMTWFAEHADVSPHVGGNWHFWGRHTLNAPTTANPADVVRAIEAPTSLSYAWSIGSTPTEVSLSLAEERGKSGEEGTRLAVRHEIAGPLPFPRPKQMIDDFWRLTVGNLSVHLAGRDGVVKPDFADASPEIRLSILIGAPPESVFRALLEPAALNAWIAWGGASVEPHVGGRYTFGWKYPVDGREVEGGPTTILELVPNERLVLDWPDWRGDPNVPKQTITWLLEPVGASTRVTLIHGGFQRTVDFSDYPMGWIEFAAALKKFVEGRE